MTLVVSIATAGLTTAATCDGTITIAATIPATGAAAVNSPLTHPSQALCFYHRATRSDAANLSAVHPRRGLAIAATAEHQFDQHNTRCAELHSRLPEQLLATGCSPAPQSGSTAATTSHGLRRIPTGLTAGQYTGSITITATGPGGAAVADSPVTIPVTLNVTSVSLTLEFHRSHLPAGSGRARCRRPKPSPSAAPARLCWPIVPSPTATTPSTGSPYLPPAATPRPTALSPFPSTDPN